MAHSMDSQIFTYNIVWDKISSKSFFIFGVKLPLPAKVTPTYGTCFYQYILFSKFSNLFACSQELQLNHFSFLEQSYPCRLKLPRLTVLVFISIFCSVSSVICLHVRRSCNQIIFHFWSKVTPSGLSYPDLRYLFLSVYFVQ